MRRLLARFVPASARQAIAETWYLVLNIVGGMFRRGDQLTLPKSMNFAGGGNFLAVGEEFKRYIMELGELQSWECKENCVNLLE
jgi:hypothetical protein